MLRLLGIGLTALALGAGELSAQNAVGIFARSDQWSIDSGHLSSTEKRPGFAVGLGSWGSHGAARAAFGWVSEGDVRPGWMTLGVEGGPRLVVADRVGLGAQLAVAGLDMRVDNRHEAIEACTPDAGCLFEAPTYENGWGLLAGGAIVGSLMIVDRLELTTEYGWSRIWAGANSDETLRKWSLGAQFRIR